MMELDERVYEEGKQPVVAAEDEETGDVEEGEAAANEEGNWVRELLRRRVWRVKRRTLH